MGLTPCRIAEVWVSAAPSLRQAGAVVRAMNAGLSMEPSSASAGCITLDRSLSLMCLSFPHHRRDLKVVPPLGEGVSHPHRTGIVLTDHKLAANLPAACVLGLANTGKGCGDSRSMGWWGVVPSY